MNHVLNRIIDFRKRNGLTQKQMADQLNIGQVAYSQIETGKTEITLQRLSQIARILNTDIVTILFPDFNVSKEFEWIRSENQLLKEKNLLLWEQLEDKKLLIEALCQLFPEVKDFVKLKSDYNKYRFENRIGT